MVNTATKLPQISLAATKKPAPRRKVKDLDLIRYHLDNFRGKTGKNIAIEFGGFETYSHNEELTERKEAKLSIVIGEDNLYDFMVTVQEEENYTTLASFTLEEQTNCCGMVVLTDIETEYAKYGKQVHELAVAIAKAAGYSTIICTDTSEAHKKVLSAADWHIPFTFTNKRTSNRVYLAYKKI